MGGTQVRQQAQAVNHEEGVPLPAISRTMVEAKGRPSCRLELSPRNGDLGLSGCVWAERKELYVLTPGVHGFRSSGLNFCSASTVQDLAFLRLQNEDTGTPVTRRHHLGGELSMEIHTIGGTKSTRSTVILLQRRGRQVRLSCVHSFTRQTEPLRMSLALWSSCSRAGRWL